MAVFGVITENDCDRFMQESSDRIHAENTAIIFYDSYIMKVDDKTYLINLRPNFPPFYWAFLIPYFFGVGFGLAWLAWLSAILFVVVLFFFTRYYYFLGIWLGIKKRRLGKVKLMRDADLIKVVAERWVLWGK